MYDVTKEGHSSKVAGVQAKLLVTIWGKRGWNPGPFPWSTHGDPLTYGWSLNAKGGRCINSVLVNILTKGRGGAILPMEGTNLYELKKIGNKTDRV